MKFRWFLYFVSVYLLFGMPIGWSYTDEIGASMEETWVAAKEALQPYGIKKSDPLKMVLETDWIQDRVTRSKKLIPFLKGPEFMKQTFERRYVLQVKLTTVENSTQVSVRGRFQEKPLDSRPQLSWHSVRPRSEDYIVERDLFFGILKQIEKNRLSVT